MKGLIIYNVISVIHVGTTFSPSKLSSMSCDSLPIKILATDVAA